MKPARRCVLAALALLCLGGVAPGTPAVFFQAEGPLGSDFDGDGTVAFADFLAFAAGFGARDGDDRFEAPLDLDGNGAVDFADFLRFAEAFGASGTAPSFPTMIMYAVDSGSGVIDVYSLRDHLFQDYLPFRNPTAVVVSRDQARIYVVEQFGVFQLSPDHRVLMSIPANAAGRIALSADGARAFVSEPLNDLVRVIDLASFAAVDTVTVADGPADLAVTPDGRWLYAAQGAGLSVVDLSGPAEVLRVDTNGAPRSICFTRDGRKGYYLVRSRGAVGVLDVATNRVLGEIALEEGAASDLALAAGDRCLYATTPTSLVEIDVARNLVVRRLEVGSETSTLGLTPDGAWAYVGASEPAVFVPGLAVVNLITWELAGRVRGFAFPLEIAFRRTVSP